MLLTRFQFAQAEVGALQPPQGVIPNLKNPENKVYKYNIACQTLCYLLVGACVLARLYTKVFIRPELRIEDYTCILAWVLAVAFSALALACIQYRGGVHQWNVSLHDVIAFARIQYFGELVYYPTAFFTKTSILCLIARVFAPQRKAVLLIRLTICLMLLYYLPAFFVKLFRCNPIHKAWDVKVPGKCVTTESSIFLADCIVSLVSDLTILILPMPLVWKLQAPLRRKLRIMVVFAGGVLAVAAIIARMIQNSTLDAEDGTFSVQVIMLLAIAEVNFGIICSCLPVLPILFQHISRPKRSTQSAHTTYHRLEPLILSTSGVERVQLSHTERERAEAVIEAAVHKETPGVDHSVNWPSVSVMRGPDPVGESGTLWNGDGILEIVDVERTGISLLERAALPREHVGLR